MDEGQRILVVGPGVLYDRLSGTLAIDVSKETTDRLALDFSRSHRDGMKKLAEAFTKIVPGAVMATIIITGLDS